ncbi:YcaO-like family protein [Amycolatopsis sp. NBC_01480]|uniref:YcaO-like family protein n=1 Tax=Amycolatopsis sp. NBC_01480 TaxID=2903562 RepID=UPI002E294839|nr:YcaO-like family protein [Amycolatopsis sp. NBC_01480]
MRAVDVAVFRHLRDHSLISVRGRQINLPIQAESIAGTLSGRHVIPTPTLDGEAAAADNVVNRLGQLLSRAQTATCSASDVSVLIDGSLSDLLGPSVVQEQFAAIGAKEFASTTQPHSELSADLLVTLTDSFDYERFCQWEDLASARGIPWAPWYLTERGAAFGPYFEPGSSPGTRDLVGRWITAAKEESRARAMARRPVFSTWLDRSRGSLMWLLATFIADLSAWLYGDGGAGRWHHVTADAESLAVQRHPVLPLPQAERDLDVSGSPLNVRDVVSRSTGIVVGLRPITLSPSMPTGITYVESQTADMSRLEPWSSNIYNAGSSWDDPGHAEQGAIGEAIERYCGNFVDESRLVRASYRELCRRGVRAVDPRSLALFSNRQYQTPGFPFVEFGSDVTTSWTLGRSLVTEEDVFVPASLVYVNWNTGRSIFDPPTNPAYYPGIAAGTSLDDALSNALEEVVERDASTVWWLSGARMATTGGPLIDSLTSRVPAGSSISTEVIPIPNAAGFPVMAGVVTDPDSSLCTLGLACRSTPEEAAKKALLEAFGLLESALDMQRLDGGFWQAYESSGAGIQAVKPIRSDRRYLDSYRQDFRDVTDLFCQLQVQLDPRACEIVSQRWDTDSQVDWDKLPRMPDRSTARYVDSLAEVGFEPIWVDLTTIDARAAGWHAVRVLAPGLVPNFPTAFAPLGGGRVLAEPARLGWADQVNDEASVWRFPMPYA